MTVPCSQSNRGFYSIFEKDHNGRNYIINIFSVLKLCYNE